MIELEDIEHLIYKFYDDVIEHHKPNLKITKRRCEVTYTHMSMCYKFPLSESMLERYPMSTHSYINYEDNEVIINTCNVREGFYSFFVKFNVVSGSIVNSHILSKYLNKVGYLVSARLYGTEVSMMITTEKNILNSMDLVTLKPTYISSYGINPRINFDKCN